MDQAMNGKSSRCAVVLAGGSGQRLSGLVRRLRGDDLPKQYVGFTSAGSLLEQTCDRVERVIEPDRVFTVATRAHLGHPEVAAQLDGRHPGTVVVQPNNKETAPGVLLPLLHIEARYPDSAVAVFPSDHYVAETGRFMGYVDLALCAVERDPSRIVLLGVAPDVAESDYGYVVPGPVEPGVELPGMRRVDRFVEKPAAAAARELIRGGALWNTMVMVFRTRTLLDFVARVVPDLARAFGPVPAAIGTAEEEAAVEAVYRELPVLNFSRALLEAMPGYLDPSLMVLPLRGVSWSDWGSERRAADILERIGGAEWDPALRQPAPPVETAVCRASSSGNHDSTGTPVDVEPLVAR